MAVNNLSAKHITLPDGSELYNGSIVLLPDSDTIKYILHFGFYLYEGTVCDGAYFYSIPDGDIVLADGSFLECITVISNGHSEFPPTPPEDEDEPVVIDVATDDKSIEVKDDILQIKDFLTKYSKIEDNEEIEIDGFARDLRPITVPDGEDSYKLKWIKDRRAQELDFFNTDADNEYPSVRAVLTDKLIEVVDKDGNLIPLDETTAFKNITGNAFHQFASRKIQNPNLWELETGCYTTSGKIKVAPNEYLDNSSGERLILINNAVVSAPVYLYVAIITPISLVEQSSGIAAAYCFYIKDSTDPEDYGYGTSSVLTSLVVDTEIGAMPTDSKIPTSLAVKNYIDSRLQELNGG